MSDSLSNIPHIVICAADLDPVKIKPLLQDRNDALDYLSVGEEILKDLSDSKLLDKFKREDSDKLEAALAVLKKALLGEYDQFGDRTKPPVSLDKMAEAKATFEKALEDIAYRSREYIRTKMFHKEDGREERLEKSFEAHKDRIDMGPYRKVKPKPTKELKPIIEDPKAWNYYGVGESAKGRAPQETSEAPSEPSKEEEAVPMEGLVDVKWPKTPGMPKIKKVPARDTDNWFKVEPAISELINLPTGRDSTLGEGPVDDILRILDQEVALDVFLEKARRLAPSYYHPTGLEERVKQLQENVATAPEEYQDKLKKALAKAEDHLKNVQTFNTNLKFLHKNWIPEMKSKSSLVKDISDNYRLVLGDREITLSTAHLEASILFSSVSETCKKFIDINTVQDVEALFDVATLMSLEKQSAPLETLVKPNTKGPSAEEEKPMVTAIVEWLNASNAQGTEEDIEKMVESYLNEKAPDYHDENIARVARKAFAEWKASQPIPSEVGQEGKSNVGVANADGTGVFIEPNRGNSNVQNEAPMGIRKEAVAIYLSRKNAEGKEEHLCMHCKAWYVPIDASKEAARTPESKEQWISGICSQKCWDDLFGGEAEDDLEKKASVKCILCANMVVEGSSEYRTLKGDVCNDHSVKDITIAMTTEAEVCSQCDTGAHERCSKNTCACGCRKATKEAGQEESIMVFNTGDTALLNTRVGALDEGTEVVITSSSGDEVSFTAGSILGITKSANLDKILITKEAGSENEKYPWDNDGLKFKYNLGDRVRAGSVEHDGMSLKGKEGVIRDKVIMAAGEGAEQFYLVEFDGCGTATIPEEALSKAGKQPKTESALNHDEFTKEAVIKPNFDAVQEFLNSYDHPPTVVTTADIEAWMADPKNNYQYSKKDLKEFVKYLQSAKVEVRVPAKREAPDVLPDDEMAPIEELKKEAKKYKMEQTKPDGSKVTMEKEITEDMGPSFETEDPATPGIKNKWVASSKEVTASCTKCSGVGSLPCECMDSTLWLTNSCKKCNDEGATPCPSCKK